MRTFLFPFLLLLLAFFLSCAQSQIAPACAGGAGSCLSGACPGLVSASSNCSAGLQCCLIDWGVCETSTGNGSCTVTTACIGVIGKGSCVGGPTSVGCCVPTSSQYLNPVIPALNLPDPDSSINGAGVMLNPGDGLYYATMTTNINTNPNKYPIFSSPDLANWTQVGYVFPNNQTPSWAVQDFCAKILRAPEIHLINGRYMVYFAARNAAGMLSVGVATSANIQGPYVDVLGQPLVTNSSVGNIDPTYFFDSVSGQGYLVWKEDGNDPAHYEPETPIWAQPIDQYGRTLLGSKQMLIDNNRTSWEGGLVEAPWVIVIGQYYYLFYSANVYDTTSYAIGVARATSFLGPYEKNPANPIVQSNSRFGGPGHCSVLALTSSGPYVVLYHSWFTNAIGGLNPRVFMLDSFTINANGWPVLQDDSPSFLPMPIPKL